jgi:predicted GH43/DUF377 family glycosyl hydrolase
MILMEGIMDLHCRPVALDAIAVIAVLSGACAVAADYAGEIGRDAPAAWWRFDDPSSVDGAAAAAAAGGAPAAFRGEVALESGPAGIGGRAARFGGKGWIEAPGGAIPSGAITIEFWLRTRQRLDRPFWPASATLVSKATEGNGSGDWTIVGGSLREGEDEGRVLVGVGPRPGADVVLVSPPGLNDGAWHPIVWTRTAAGESRLFVDGGLAATASDSGGSIASGRPIQVGADPFLGGKPFEGEIAEVAIYAIALPAERLAAHARAGGLEPRTWPAPGWIPAGLPARSFVLRSEDFRHHVDRFNAKDRETVVQHVPNRSAWEWMDRNVPIFECPDREIEETYWFRWWTFRKHLKETPAGFIVTEFLPAVGWASRFNSIACAAGHHIDEGRWIRDRRYLDDYSRFWFEPDPPFPVGKGRYPSPRRYSNWLATAILDRSLVTGDRSLPIELLPRLVANFEAWEKERRDAGGLFWQIDDRDGMEVSIGGSGYRATINSYMFGDATAIARIAAMAGKDDPAARFRAEAERIRRLANEKLWDGEAAFYKVLPRGEGARLADVRELHGYTPWAFGLAGPGQAAAWKQLADPQGFLAPFGPTTAERRHPRFMFENKHECLWNGPSWPYATSVTLKALARHLHEGGSQAIGKKEYLDVLGTYARSHRLKLADGTVVPWIDEDLHPDTGAWIARDILAGRGVHDRGKDYNHSTFCDLVISGLCGVIPREDEAVDVDPLVPDRAWDWFALDRVPYHGRTLTVLWDRTGGRYGRGAGLRVLVDGIEAAAAPGLGRVTAKLPPPRASAPPDVETAAGWRKAPESPVLGGDLGTCFDISVLREGGKYRMWFSWRPRKSIALAESSDGVRWSRPVIVLGPRPGTGWEDDMNRPVVVRDGGAYRIWYTGQARGRSSIGAASSPDGRTWMRTGDRPVLSPELPWEKVAVMCPHVERDGSGWRMWYSGGDNFEPDAIGHATSPDGLAWTKDPANPIFRPDPASEWEKDRVTACQAIRLDGWWILFYIGFSDKDHARIGVARSRDGIRGWERHPENPILRPGAGRWDGDAVYKPYAILDGDRWLLWYNGRKGGVEQIGLAVHEGRDLGF